MIGEKILKIMEEIQPILKTEENEGENFKSPKVEKIVEMVRPLLIKNKVIVVPSAVTNIIPQGNKVYLTMKYELIDAESENKDYIEIEIAGSGFDLKGGRAVFAALTGAYRYLLQQSFAIPIVDEINNNGTDDDNNIEPNEQKENNNYNSDNLEPTDLDALFSSEDVA